MVSVILISAILSLLPNQRLIDAPTPRPYSIWADEAPASCPIPKSKSLIGIGFTGKHAEYTNADTWYPSWASDGNLYSPWTDGTVNGVNCGSWGENPSTGNARILGDDPMNLTVDSVATYPSSPKPYAGRYPCGSLVYNGVWYYGTYCLNPSPFEKRNGITYNWPWLGPFVGFRWSTDLGKTWTQTPCTPEHPLFGENALKGEPLKIGAPHFVDFGKNMEHSPDGKAYLVAQGASDGKNRRFGYNSWITADQAYLIRVTPSIETMNDPKAYEFFAGKDASGKDIWTHGFSQIQPIAEFRDHFGCVTMTYNAPLKKYLMCVVDGGNTVSKYNTMILESDKATGPWKRVALLRNFGEQAYFVNIPSKFIDPKDGRNFWLCYAANFATNWNGEVISARPQGGRYGMCLQQVHLIDQSEGLPDSELASSSNIAPLAAVSASSVYSDYTASGATDGNVGGFPGNTKQEWASNGESDSALIRLTWPEAVEIDRVWLFDRPNDLDQITSGLLLFSDGSTIKTGPLPDDAKQGLEVKFKKKKVKWLAFLVTGAKKGSPNIGLSEIAVFRAKPKS